MLKLKDRNMTKTGIDYLGWRPYGGRLRRRSIKADVQSQPSAFMRM